ncbi:hypothetical protein, conserved [Eimeria maxima]|uniref:SET domain-containing protein n=1 Tax=Eimeria maxima TaxID=5804 RepID=U6MAP3_EIMMA|nr:hypothetical protein, conserved [Eimeria maxima]CDJ60118.1 hypothetical protein, conserved [Eimeria maxima]
MQSDFEWATDYAALCTSYPFTVSWGPHGKELRASQPIASGQTLLVEAPLVAWPVKSSAAFEAFSFCENCLRIRPFHPQPTQHKIKQRHASGSSAPAAPTGATKHPEENVSEDAMAVTSAAASGGDEEEAGICVRDAGGREPLWFCSPRCYRQAYGTPKTPDVEEDLPSAASVAPRSKRNLDGSLASPATSRNGNSTSSWDEQREFGWMELLPLGALLRLRHYDQQQLVDGGSEASTFRLERTALEGDAHAERASDGPACSRTCVETNDERNHTTGQDTIIENPIGVEALGRTVARVAATTATLRNAFSLDLESAYAEACRPFLRLCAAAPAEVLGAVDLQRAQQLLQQQLGTLLAQALGPEAAEALLGESALAFFYGGLMRNAQALLLWGATTAGSLMVLRGAGVYVLQACCNHSCIPNCSVHNDQDAFISLKADKDIKVGDEITITYVPLDLTTAQRQQLLNNYQFTCSCTRCTDEMEQQQRHQPPQ